VFLSVRVAAENPGNTVGFAIVGGIAEVLGLVSTCALLVLLRGQQTSFILTFLAALSFLGMLACLSLGTTQLIRRFAPGRRRPCRPIGSRYATPGTGFTS